MLWLVVIWNGIIMQHVRAHSVRLKPPGKRRICQTKLKEKVIYGIVVRILYCYSVTGQIIIFNDFSLGLNLNIVFQH